MDDFGELVEVDMVLDDGSRLSGVFPRKTTPHLIGTPVRSPDGYERLVISVAVGEVQAEMRCVIASPDGAPCAYRLYHRERHSWQGANEMSA